jgi:hypothetical protein
MISTGEAGNADERTLSDAGSEQRGREDGKKQLHGGVCERCCYSMSWLLLQLTVFCSVSRRRTMQQTKDGPFRLFPVSGNGKWSLLGVRARETKKR